MGVTGVLALLLVALLWSLVDGVSLDAVSLGAVALFVYVMAQALGGA